MEIDKVIGIFKWTIGLAAGAGLLVIVAKDGPQLGQFMNGTSTAIVNFGKGIGSIA